MTDDADAQATLLAAVYARPDDDAPRLVYADWLAERGNARGEFIQLQVRRARGASERGDRAREDRLLRVHLREWLADFGATVMPGTAVFERGFLAACRVRAIAPADAARPAWATVGSLEFHARAPLALHGGMAALRTLRLRGAHALEPLAACDGALAVTALEWAGLDVGASDGGPPGVELARPRRRAPTPAELFPRVRCLPRLRALRVHALGARVADLRWVWSSPAGATIETFRASMGVASLPAWVGEAPRLPANVRELAIDSERDLGAATDSWRFTLARDDDDQRMSVLTLAVDRPPMFVAATTYTDVANVLEQLPRDALTSVELAASGAARPTPSQLERLAAAARRQVRLRRLALPEVRIERAPR